MPRVNVTFTEEEYKHINEVVNKRGITASEYVRELYFEGKKVYGANENIDLIIDLLDERLEAVINPYAERIVKIAVKGAIMSASSVFLNAQALQDLVPLEARRTVKESYERARKKVIEYIKSNGTDFKDE